jgi:hypothetical protein
VGQQIEEGPLSGALKGLGEMTAVKAKNGQHAHHDQDHR